MSKIRFQCIVPNPWCASWGLGQGCLFSWVGSVLASGGYCVPLRPRAVIVPTLLAAGAEALAGTTRLQEQDLGSTLWPCGHAGSDPAATQASLRGHGAVTEHVQALWRHGTAVGIQRVSNACVQCMYPMHAPKACIQYVHPMHTLNACTQCLHATHVPPARGSAA